MPNPQKDDDPRNRTGGLVQEIFQKVQIFHELEFSYASFMLLLRYCLCVLYTDYYSTKKSPKELCYLNTILLLLFHDMMLLWFTVYFMLLWGNMFTLLL